MTLDPNSPEARLQQEQIQTEIEAEQAERDRQRKLRDHEREAHDRERLADAEARAKGKEAELSEAESREAQAELDKKRRGREMAEEELKSRQVQQAQDREEQIEEVMKRHGVGRAQAERIVDGTVTSHPATAGGATSIGGIIDEELAKGLGNAIALPIKAALESAFAGAPKGALTEDKVRSIIKEQVGPLVDEVKRGSEPEQIVNMIKGIFNAADTVKKQLGIEKGEGDEDLGKIGGSDTLKLEIRKLGLEDRRERLKLKREQDREDKRAEAERLKGEGIRDLGSAALIIASGGGKKLVEGMAKNRPPASEKPQNPDMEAAVIGIECPGCGTQYRVLADAKRHYCEKCQKLLILEDETEAK